MSDPYRDFQQCEACGQLAPCFAGRCRACTTSSGAEPATSTPARGGGTSEAVADEIARIYGIADDATLARCAQRDAARARERAAKRPKPGTEAFRDAVADAIDREMGGA